MSTPLLGLSSLVSEVLALYQQIGFLTLVGLSHSNLYCRLRRNNTTLVPRAPGHTPFAPLWVAPHRATLLCPRARIQHRMERNDERIYPAHAIRAT